MAGGITTVYNNGKPILKFDRSSQSSYTCDYNVFVGCVNTKGTKSGYFVGNLYRMRFGSTADFVPCVRDSDSAAGMYDIVRETFYPSSGDAFGTPTE